VLCYVIYIFIFIWDFYEIENISLPCYLFFSLDVFSDCILWTGSIQILSRGRTVMVNSGQSVTLECQVRAEPDSFHLFRNPVVWNKTQHLEECRITMMGSTQEPFNSEVRFNPSYAPNNPPALKHLFELSINSEYTWHVV